MDAIQLAAYGISAGGWAHRCVEEAQTSRKELFITPREEGADTHAIGTNLSLMDQPVFDWLDETSDR